MWIIAHIYSKRFPIWYRNKLDCCRDWWSCISSWKDENLSEKCRSIRILIFYGDCFKYFWSNSWFVDYYNLDKGNDFWRLLLGIYRSLDFRISGSCYLSSISRLIKVGCWSPFHNKIWSAGTIDAKSRRFSSRKTHERSIWWLESRIYFRPE